MTKGFPVLKAHRQVKDPDLRKEMVDLLADCPDTVPWDMVVAHEEQVRRNHSQSVQRLSERGGLAPDELYYALRDRDLLALGRPRTDQEKVKDLRDAIEFIKSFAQRSPDAGSGGHEVAIVWNGDEDSFQRVMHVTQEGVRALSHNGSSISFPVFENGAFGQKTFSVGDEIRFRFSSDTHPVVVSYYTHFPPQEAKRK